MLPVASCGARLARMAGPEGEVVWSSGKMSKRMWEDVRENTHGGSTFDYICRSLGKS